MIPFVEEVKERQNWPQVIIDHVLNPETVDYNDLDWAGLTAERLGKYFLKWSLLLKIMKL